ncbi:cytidine/deoxycytidylate deaminase family protein [Streptomyces cinereoruber]|uniref:hypothetical protein n=1 Tax=Streptomyces cinereoruber TaxID=67260 RepID=UPI003643A44A
MRLAIKQAQTSSCRFKVGAVLGQGKRVFAASANLRRNSPMVDHLHATFHAEEAALRRTRNAEGIIAYVARVGPNGATMMARPCPRCQTALRRAGVEKAFYTTSHGTVSVLRLR